MEREITAIVTAGIDLAKNVFAVQGVHALAKPKPMRPEVPPAK
jgi:transposase